MLIDILLDRVELLIVIVRFLIEEWLLERVKGIFIVVFLFMDIEVLFSVNEGVVFFFGGIVFLLYVVSVSVIDIVNSVWDFFNVFIWNFFVIF